MGDPCKGYNHIRFHSSLNLRSLTLRTIPTVISPTLRSGWLQRIGAGLPGSSVGDLRCSSDLLGNDEIVGWSFAQILAFNDLEILPGHQFFQFREAKQIYVLWHQPYFA